MRRVCVVVALCAVVLLSLGCSWYRAPVMPPYGSLFADISAPMTVDYEGQAVAPNQGRASAKSVLGLIAWGDCSVQAAAQRGGLRKIHYCDYEYMNVLGFYQSFTVVARGE